MKLFSRLINSKHTEDMQKKLISQYARQCMRDCENLFDILNESGSDYTTDVTNFMYQVLGPMIQSNEYVGE